MTLNNEQLVLIEQIIKDNILQKLKTYKLETNHMPFHYRLIGRDRMALYLFIQSLNTTFWVSIFEPVAELLAKFKYPFAQKQYPVGNTISQGAQIEIQQIMNDLTTGKVKSSKNTEIERIRKVCITGGMNKLKSVRADLFIRNNEGIVFLIDLKTVKPNISDFKDYKRTLLEWVAVYLAQNPTAETHSFIAIPYNPYERWTLYSMLDLEQELKVAEEFWDFLGGDGAYEEILACFERAGIALSPEFDAFFSKFS